MDMVFSKKKPKQWVLQALSFISHDSFNAQFLGCEGTEIISRSETMAHIALDEQADYDTLFNLAVTRGSNPLRWTRFIGKTVCSSDDPEAGGGPQIAPRSLDWSATITRYPPVVHQSTDDGCVPYALLNVLGASKRKAKILMQRFNKGTSKQGDLALLSRDASIGLKCHLLSVIGKDVDWLLSQTNGQYIVVDGVHAVGVDCGKRLIFDCSKPVSIDLTKLELSSCGIHNVLEMRKVSTD